MSQGFQVGDMIDGPACNPTFYPAEVLSFDPNTRYYKVRYKTGKTVAMDTGFIAKFGIVKVGTAASQPAALQVGDLVEITERDVRNYVESRWPEVENRWRVTKIYPDGDAEVTGRGIPLLVSPHEVRKIGEAAAPADPVCTCNLWIGGHTCGMDNSDPWRALAGVFQ